MDTSALPGNMSRLAHVLESLESPLKMTNGDSKGGMGRVPAGNLGWEFRGRFGVPLCSLMTLDNGDVSCRKGKRDYQRRVITELSIVLASTLLNPLTSILDSNNFRGPAKFPSPWCENQDEMPFIERRIRSRGAQRKIARFKSPRWAQVATAIAILEIGRTTETPIRFIDRLADGVISVLTR